MFWPEPTRCDTGSHLVLTVHPAAVPSDPGNPFLRWVTDRSLGTNSAHDHHPAMTTLVVKPAARTPADARAVARRTLRDLDRRLGATATATTLNAYMTAHVEESRARIQKALSAGLEAER